MAEQDRSFRVLYTKGGNKKRKTYQDGILSVSSSALTLIDADGKDEIGRASCRERVLMSV